MPAHVDNDVPTTDRFLSPRQVELEYEISTHTLQHWRYQGRGPAYYKLGSRVRYLRSELEAWLRGHRIDPDAA